MKLKFTVGDLTIHRIIEQETTFLPALDLLPALTPDLLAEHRPWLREAGAIDAEAGRISLGDIDFVMCTHLHVHHVGWNTRLENGRWVPTFPNARYVFGKTEFDYWTEQHAKPPIPPFGDSVLPVVEAKRAEIVREDYSIGDHARILPT